VAATTGYQAALYLALGLSVIAITLAVLATRTQTPVDTRKSTSTLEEQGSEAALKR